MRVTACRFCGVPTDVPHETQELCIAALQDEVARMRDMVTRVKKPAPDSEIRAETNAEINAEINRR
jgi:hypothetical protein